MTKHHGMSELKGIGSHCKRGHVAEQEDRFGRMFPELAASYIPADVLAEIGAKGGPMDGGNTANRTKTVPVGHVFFGQFVDHDITLDVSSSFSQVNDPSETPNLRTPTLDLDCIYGAGPESHAYLYVNEDGNVFSGAKLLTGADMRSTGDADADALQANDLLRAPSDRAIIGDHRNDENRIVSQLQLAMINFHNCMCDIVHAEHPEYKGGEIHEEARQRTMWHYQWGVVNDFLVAMCGDAVVWDILSCGRKYFCPVTPHIPIEFAVAAYRFGHSMAPLKIQVQHKGKQLPLFGDVLGKGFTPVADKAAIVDWRELMFVEGGVKSKVQTAEKMDTTMASILLELPFVDPSESPENKSLATRNLRRGNSFLLPGGDKVAEHMGRPETEIAKVMKRVGEISDGRIKEGAPLWLYLLAEGEVIGREAHGGKFEKGEGLGPVGARIVAEVLIGLLELDDTSYLGANRNWLPMEQFNTIGKILVSQNAASLAATS